jgi:hypothetical protein
MAHLRIRTSTWMVGMVIGLLLVLLTLGNYRFALISPGGNDFGAHYTVWQAYLEHGLNPYSDEAALFTQQMIYGRPARPTEDQNRLTYPFYSIVLHGPFVLIRDYSLARAVYMTLLEAALLVGVWLTMRTVKWRPPFWLLAATLLWVLLDYPQARGLILGQFAIFGFFSVALTLYLLQRGHDGWAGAILVLATMKPTLVFLVVPFLVLWALLRRRWRFVIGLGVTLGGALLGSWLMLPTWLTDWLLRVDLYSAYTVGQSPVWLLTHQALPALGQMGEVLITALLVGLMFVAWWQAFRMPDEDLFYWTLGVTLVVSDLIVARSATTNYALLLLPTMWLFEQLERHRRGHRVIVGYFVLTVVGEWWLHATTVVGNQEQPIMFIPLPIVLGLALVITRTWPKRHALTSRIS